MLLCLRRLEPWETLSLQGGDCLLKHLVQMDMLCHSDETNSPLPGSSLRAQTQAKSSLEPQVIQHGRLRRCFQVEVT